MANPSPAAVTAIRARVAALGLSWPAQADAQVLAALEADAAANPAPRRSLPRAFSLADLVNLVDPIRRAAFRAYLPALAPLVIAQDRLHLAAGVLAVLAIGDLVQSESDAMIALLSTTDPDPAWPATVPQIQLTLGRALDPADVAAARAAGGN